MKTLSCLHFWPVRRRNLLCEETSIIDTLKKAGGEARVRGKCGWDVPTKLVWSADELIQLKTAISEVRTKNVWHTYQLLHTDQVIHAASDASGTIGFGGVAWRCDGSVVVVIRGTWALHCKAMIDTHIFLKEYLTATLTIQKLCEQHQQSHLVLCIDNTAVIHSLRALYSSNTNACGYNRRICAVLTRSENRLEIVPVVSNDNAADATSRNLILLIHWR
jgi:hypothetical protein